MAEYNFTEIEQKWQQYWESNKTFLAEVDPDKPKYYTLDMFPYPSGAGLHVGHPLGYIASDIISRYKKIKGYNVLHPIGFDAFGLPAEQYAIQTGQHPAITTEQNITRYKEQMKNIGFAFDWSKEFRTSEPDYYRWTQWIFTQLFNSWYDKYENKARDIESLISLLEKEGSTAVHAVCHEDTPEVSAQAFKALSEEEKYRFLLNYRLAYLDDTTVNWCAELGTVLANEEVKDGVSERGGFPVERKTMKQWSLRITAYAERLLDGLASIDWPEPLREMQRNWIGKSIGADLQFKLKGFDESITVFTTRVDTVYGVTYLALAPEIDLVDKITTEEHKDKIKDYVAMAKNRSERDRMSDVKTISGEFTGAYAIHPFSGEEIPIWVADYVLAGYGTGAVMAVPAHDTRDYAFAKHFNLPIIPVVSGGNLEEGAYAGKEGTIINSDFLDGLEVQDAIKAAIAKLEVERLGSAKINYKMRDAIFSRQRYWGEPFPVYFKNDLPYLINEDELPLELPEVDKYLPTADGAPPLGRAEAWTSKEGYPYELSTMPGWAGSSWYFFRYMDAQNSKSFAAKEALDYWENVDLYIGGAEHATGHLLYARFWTKFLKDRGFVKVDEPFKKLINQGMIQGRSNFVYRVQGGGNKFVSYHLKEQYETVAMHVDVNIVNNDVLDLEAFKAWRPDLADATFILEDDKYICGFEVEKMSKSKYNVVNPDDIIAKFGADTLRLYEMFLGPLEQFKPWNTNGIDGVHKFLKKLWRLFHNADGQWQVSDDKANAAALKVLHKTIKKVEEDIERYSFNTVVSTLMICVNELAALKVNQREILDPLVRLISPYAPHLAEELWQQLGNASSITEAKFPQYNEDFLIEAAYEYPVSINGKMRVKISFPITATKEAIEEEVLQHETIVKWTEGKKPKKMIIVPQKIVNIVM